MPSDLKQKTGGFDIRITVVELYGGELNEQEKNLVTICHQNTLLPREALPAVFWKAPVS